MAKITIRTPQELQGDTTMPKEQRVITPQETREIVQLLLDGCSTVEVGALYGVGSSRISNLARREGLRYQLGSQGFRDGRWKRAEDVTGVTPQHKKARVEDAIVETAMSIDDYEQLLESGRDMGDPDYSIEAPLSDIEVARALVQESVTAIRNLQGMITERDKHIEHLQATIEDLRAKCARDHQDALRWREHHHQENLRKQQMSAGLLRQGNAELRALLDDVAAKNK
jgi:hypothetical protein